MKILKASELPPRRVDISEWSDEPGYVKTLSLEEWFELEAKFVVTADKTRPSRERLVAEAETVVATLVDAEGRPLLDASQVDDLINRVDPAPTARIVDLCVHPFKPGFDPAAPQESETETKKKESADA